MSSHSFLSNSMEWIRKSVSEEERSHNHKLHHKHSVDQPKHKQSNHSHENTGDNLTEEKGPHDKGKLKTVVKKSKPIPAPPPHLNSRSQSPEPVSFIKNLWSAQRSFDAATSAAMRTLQKRPLVRPSQSCQSPPSGHQLSASSFPALRRPQPLDDLGEDLLPVEGDSEIFTQKDFVKLRRELPKRLEGSSWIRTFTTSQDGFSLATVYRRMKPYHTLPALLVIRDTNGHRFGAFVSEAFHLTEKSFGCGESFVFRMAIDDGELQVWKWTCKNDFFVLCSNSSLCVGIDDGKFSIFLDESLYKGRSQKCKTFDNEPLTPTGDFEAASVEVWNFE